MSRRETSNNARSTARPQPQAPSPAKTVTESEFFLQSVRRNRRKSHSSKNFRDSITEHKKSRLCHCRSKPPLWTNTTSTHPLVCVVINRLLCSSPQLDSQAGASRSFCSPTCAPPPALPLELPTASPPRPLPPLPS